MDAAAEQTYCQGCDRYSRLNFLTVVRQPVYAHWQKKETVLIKNAIRKKGVCGVCECVF